MSLTEAELQQTEQQKTLETIQLKRQVTLKTLVNQSFREKAAQELADETKLIDTQLSQLDAQYQYSLQQLEVLAQQGQAVHPQLEALNREAQDKRGQLARLKMEVSTQMANLDKIPNGTYIVTGQLENFVNLQPGDNIYDKLRNAEILIEDGVIQLIRG